MSNRVLIIDDSRTDFIIMKSLLLRSDEAYEILHNMDGKKVVHLAEEMSVDVIILDLLIDSVDGIDVLLELKDNENTKDIPIIICSSIGDKETIKKTLSLGAYDYFEKPLSDMALEFGFVLKVKNALESKQRSDKVSYLRNHDELTGLWTRKYFELELQKLSEHNVLPVGVVILDINGLKVLNDAYGHQYGDNILKHIGHILNTFCESCHCKARWGGDEIAILLPKATRRVIDEIIVELERRFDLEEAKYSLTFGWALETKHLKNIKYLVQQAEDKLYSNKILESNSSRSSLIDTILKTLHQKNPREEMHSHRVSVISEEIAKKLCFSKYEIKKVKMAGLLHDIGKISIDEGILNKPSRLNKDEWEAIKKHPEYGFKILSTSVDTLEIAKAILAHHERWDGNGYPKGTMKSDIPIMARIIAVADTFDAITSLRSYKHEISEDEALVEIKRCSGTQFDPIVVDAFIEYIAEVGMRKAKKMKEA
jgi:diguanylate cyclase (GGDEF)-like protein/putative nucleotidyltransferase with HDIG domain